MSLRGPLSSQPVNVRLVPGGEASRPTSISADVLRDNTDFCAFAERMKDTARVFVVGHGTAPETVACDTDNPLSADANRRWLDCCLWDYLDRKKRFDSRFRSRKELILKVLTVVAIVLGVLYACWPIWEVFIDVEAESFYRTLEVNPKATSAEIKKAYREQMKKWHPDRNPTCGERCRTQSMKIQQAHDVLLQRGDQRFALANRYREELLQLRSMVFFRVYSMAFSSAQALFYIVRKAIHRRLSDDEEFALSAFCKIGTLVFFTTYEVVFVSGFNPFMVFQVFYYCVTVARASAQEKLLDAARKASYVDLTREAWSMIPALTVLHAVVLSGSTASTAGWAESAFQMTFGSLYVLSFLYNFTPNVHDNFLLRKCSLPIRYVSPSTLRFSWTAFVTSELGFLVDDLFVFTCRVPGIYRFAVYGVHCVFLCQMALLPWDAPVRSKQRASATAPSSAQPHQSAGTTLSSPTTAQAGDQERVGSNPVIVRGASASEIEMLSNLDTEPTPWLDVIMIKYKRLLEALSRDYARRFGRKPDVVDLASCTDLEHVSIFALIRDKDGSEEKQKLNHLCKIKDPRFSRWLAIERGSRLMLPANPAELRERSVQSIYKEKLGPLASKTLSDVWRSRVITASPTDNGASTKQWARGAAVAVLLAFCLIFLVHPVPFLTALAGTRELSKAFRPLVLFRFVGIHAAHMLNRLAAGLAAALDGRVVLLTPDYVDSMRHLRSHNFTAA